jgi:sugar phosphate isomerase/epimerase
MNGTGYSRRVYLSGALFAGIASFAGRRLAALGGPDAPPVPPGNRVPIGLELYSVRDELAKDLKGTLRAVAGMGFTVVEFFGPYSGWTPAHARDVRRLMDDLNLRCLSTHNESAAFRPETLPKIIELNRILGAHYVVLVHRETLPSLDAWKQDVADLLTAADTTLAKEGMHAGFHNHEAEWQGMQGQLPMEVIARDTPAGVMLQLDVGTCLKTGNDPVAWIQKHPGRTRSVHLKEWTPQHGYRVVLGDDGTTPWKELFAAAESIGGVEYYLLEQEDCDFPPMDAVKRGLAEYWKLQG